MTNHMMQMRVKQRLENCSGALRDNIPRASWERLEVVKNVNTVEFMAAFASIIINSTVEFVYL